jgi:hypothetical protein
MTTITDIAAKSIMESKRCKHALGYLLDKTERTIENWTRARHAILTTPDAVTTISKETGLTDKEILTERK